MCEASTRTAQAQSFIGSERPPCGCQRADEPAKAGVMSHESLVIGKNRQRQFFRNDQSTNDKFRPPEIQFRNQASPPLAPRLPSGDQSVVEPPGPIPNPEVKRRSADGSGMKGPARVGRRQVNARLQHPLGPGSFFARMAHPHEGHGRHACAWNEQCKEDTGGPPVPLLLRTSCTYWPWACGELQIPTLTGWQVGSYARENEPPVRTGFESGHRLAKTNHHEKQIKLDSQWRDRPVGSVIGRFCGSAGIQG